MAQDTTDSIRIQVDADQMVFQVAEAVSGTDARDIRQEIDEDYGNGDGTVQANEVQKYQDEERVTFSKNAPECFEDFGLVRLDGRTPLRITEVREEIIGATNTQSSSVAPLQEVTIISFLYPAGADTVTASVALRAMSDLGSAASCQTGATFGGAYAPPGPPRGAYTPPTWSGENGSSWEEWGASWNEHGQAWADWNWTWDWDGAQQTAPEMIIRIHPLPGAKITQATVQPNSARALWDSQGLRADTDQETNMLMNTQVTFEVQGGRSGETTFAGTARDVGAVIGYTTVGVVGLAGVAALMSEFARYKMFKLLFLIPGFTRLEKDEVLEHGKRDELYRFIKTTPGPSFSDLRRELGLSNGTLVHHLRILEAQEYVKPVRDGFRTRFYIRGPKIVPTSYLTRTQQQLLEAIGSNPGLTQKELALVLGLPRESISYHTKQLAQKGKLEIKQDGKWRRYWPTQTGGGPMAAASPSG